MTFNIGDRLLCISQGEPPRVVYPLLIVGNEYLVININQEGQEPPLAGILYEDSNPDPEKWVKMLLDSYTETLFELITN